MAALFDGFGMDPCIVQNYHCRATHSPRKRVKLLTDKRGVNGLFREAQVYAVVSGQQSKLDSRAKQFTPPRFWLGIVTCSPLNCQP